MSTPRPTLDSPTAKRRTLAALGSSGSFCVGVWISIDVPGYITGNGTYNLAVTTPDSAAISLGSREARANALRFIVETAL